MTTVAVVLVAAYAVVNAFGAWAILRRKQAVAVAFMGVAVVLTVAAVAIAFGHASGLALVVIGALGASLTSWVNARAVLGRVVPWRHALRASYGVALVLVTVLAAGA